MQRPPEEQLRASMGALSSEEEIDNATAIRFKRELAEKFREQLTFGIPTAADEAGLRRLTMRNDVGAGR